MNSLPIDLVEGRATKLAAHVPSQEGRWFQKTVADAVGKGGVFVGGMRAHR
jgi:hypothetical protein